MKTRSTQYLQAGVDIDKKASLINSVKAKVSSTRRPEALAAIGGFGGLFELDLSRYQKPVLVSSIDGVGTKLMIANLLDEHRFVGHDIVNHCVNDIAVQGAEPLFFLDYFGTGKLKSPQFENVLGSMADACKAQNVTLIGGETAEMPGMYGDDYDLVGCIIGVVEKEKMITGAKIKPGHAVIGMASSGLHTNGYSLARRLLLTDGVASLNERPSELGGETVGQALLKPHVCYWPAISKALQKGVSIDGMAHLTGGGFYDNIPRVLPVGTAVEVKAEVLPVPPIMKLIRAKGDVSPDEMHHVFNMGVGMVWMVPQAEVETALACCRASGISAAVIGRVTEGNKDVTVLF